MDIRSMADERYQAGTAAGLDPAPWTDPARDFLEEAMEELADATNYTRWEMIRAMEATVDTGHLTRARSLIESAFDQLLLARIKLGGGGSGPGPDREAE